MALKQKRLAFCPLSSRVVPNKACFLGFFCPKQGEGFKPSAAHPYPNIDQVPPPPALSPLAQVRRCTLFGKDGTMHITPMV